MRPWLRVAPAGRGTDPVIAYTYVGAGGATHGPLRMESPRRDGGDVRICGDSYISGPQSITDNDLGRHGSSEAMARTAAPEIRSLLR